MTFNKCQKMFIRIKMSADNIFQNNHQTEVYLFALVLNIKTSRKNRCLRFPVLI